MIYPKVGIVIQYWSAKSRPFLDACIQSIVNLDYSDYQVVLVTPKWNAPREYAGFIRSPDVSNYTGAFGLNFGVRNLPETCEHYLLLNDDVVLTRDSLRLMMDKVLDDPGIVNPYSNDGGDPRHFPFGAYREETLIHSPRMAMMESPLIRYPLPRHEVEHLCMFATLVPKVIWDAVQGFDEFPLGGGDDIDFCWRAKEKGYRCYVALDALIFHSMGATTTTSISPKQRIENIQFFHNKWGKYPPGLGPETIKALEAQIAIQE